MRVLFFTEQWVNGGVAAFIMNVLRNFDQSINIDIFVSENSTTFYDKELQELNIKKVCLVGKSRVNPIIRVIKTSVELYQVFQHEKYDVAHFHICNAVGLIYAAIAKKAKIKKVVVHSHNSMVGSFPKILANNFFRTLFCTAPDIRLACSDYAAKLLFSPKYINQGRVLYIHNGINVKAFAFCEKARKEMRQRLSVQDEILICHIGRFIPQKNHQFLLNVFAQVDRTYPGQYKLLLIGEGNLEEMIFKQEKQLGLENKVIHISNTQEVAAYLSASDVFVLPSLFEGLPVVGIEAQSNGIPCVFSDTITKQVKILDTTVFLSLQDSYEKWAETIVRCSKAPLAARRDKWHIVLENGYDVRDVAEKLQNIYSEYGEKK